LTTLCLWNGVSIRDKKSMVCTIGFTSHRIESLCFAKKLMENYDVIIIEEAPTPGFVDMLEKKISINEYIREGNMEFPEFSRRFYEVLRILHQKGKKILQVEPYMERLMQIYEIFSVGKVPSDVIRIPGMREVYKAERIATKALLNFYESSLKAPFLKVVESVKRFARVDAKRFRLRDRMRARAIAKVLPDDKNVYVEAGAIHIYLVKVLKQILGRRYRIKSEFLLESAVKKLTGKKQVLVPGDLLTIHYILQKKADEEYETLQAARSLIYIKLLKKDEMIPSRAGQTPHVEDEIKVNELVSKLTIAQCEGMYWKMRAQGREKALEAYYF
jgi:hypothetical protein